MCRQRRGKFQNAAFRMWQAQCAGMQMQRIAEAFQMCGLTAIFTIAHDRAFQRLGAMHAKLMRAPGEWQQFQHGGLALRRIHHAVKGHGSRAFPIRRRRYAFAALPAKLGEWHIDPPLQRMRPANHDGPIGFLSIPAPERGGEFGSRRSGAPQDQNARCVLVQPMHQARAFFIAKAQRIQHASTWRVMPGPPCTGRPWGLSIAITEASR